MEIFRAVMRMGQIAGLGTALCLGAWGASAATLDGNVVDITHTGGYAPAFSAPGISVGPGVEYSIDFGLGRLALLDLGGTTISLLFQGSSDGAMVLGTVGFAFEVSSIDFGNGIDGVSSVFTEAPGSRPNGSGGAIVTSTANTVAINLQSFWEDGDALLLTLEEAAVIPTPAALPLLLGGLGAMALLGRRRARAV